MFIAIAAMGLGGQGIASASAPVLSVVVGDQTHRLDLEAIEALAGAAEAWTVLEPHEDRQRTYRGVPVRRMLDALYDDAWRQAGAVLFECADGYRALVSSDKLVDYPALLAWGDVGTTRFELVNRLQGDEEVVLGPFYLAWDNLAHPELLGEGAADWPYQVVGLALVDAREHLAAAWPDADAEPAALRGFDAFRRHCVVCHAVNGAGGGKGRDLNLPHSVTESMASEGLRRWMLDPAAMRPGTTMPGLPATLERRDAVAADIEAYLRNVAVVGAP